MIPEQDLYALGGAAREHPPRPVEEVMARGSRIRHHRIVLRVAAMTVLAAAVTAAAVGPALGSRSTPTARVGLASTPPLRADLLSGVPCPQADPGTHAKAVPQVPDDMRLIPTGVPGDPPISAAEARQLTTSPRNHESCLPTVIADADALKLVARNRAGAVTAMLTVTGPYAEVSDPDGAEPIHLRHREGMLAYDPGTQVSDLAWGERDGGHWRMHAENVNVGIVLQVAHALRLDSTPDRGTPPADLAPGAVPRGFHIVAQASTVPSLEADQHRTLSWMVQLGGPAVGPHCVLFVERMRPGFPYLTQSLAVGDTQTHVLGADAVWGSFLERLPDPTLPTIRTVRLLWDAGPGLVAELGCANGTSPGVGDPLPLAQMLQIAESVQAVAADDPRLPKG